MFISISKWLNYVSSSGVSCISNVCKQELMRKRNVEINHYFNKTRATLSTSRYVQCVPWHVTTLDIARKWEETRQEDTKAPWAISASRRIGCQLVNVNLHYTPVPRPTSSASTSHPFFFCLLPGLAAHFYFRPRSEIGVMAHTLIVLRWHALHAVLLWQKPSWIVDVMGQYDQPSNFQIWKFTI